MLYESSHRSLSERFGDLTPSSLFHAIEEVLPCTVLLHEVEVVLVHEYLLKLNDVWMIDIHKNIEFLLHHLDVLIRAHSVAMDAFEGKSLLQIASLCNNPDRTIVAIAYLFL